MSDRRLARREMRAHAFQKRGTVLTAPKLLQVTAQTETSPVCDVDVGGDEVIRDVRIRANAAGSRSYARVGAPVLLARNAAGRFEIIGPGDRVRGAGNVTLLDESDDSTSAGAGSGFTTRVEAFEFYESGGSPGPSRWNDGSTPFPAITILDGDGNPV